MLRASERVSDLIFSPGRPPQVEIHGQLIAVQGSGITVMTADDTRRIAADLIGNNKQAITTLREQGSCDISYGLPGVARFRVNLFIQRGSCAIVMRVIPTVIPDLVFAETARRRSQTSPTCETESCSSPAARAAESLRRWPPCSTALTASTATTS